MADNTVQGMIATGNTDLGSGHDRQPQLSQGLRENKCDGNVSEFL
jgi:hypothetical protein